MEHLELLDSALERGWAPVISRLLVGQEALWALGFDGAKNPGLGVPGREDQSTARRRQAGPSDPGDSALDTVGQLSHGGRGASSWETAGVQHTPG